METIKELKCYFFITEENKEVGYTTSKLVQIGLKLLNHGIMTKLSHIFDNKNQDTQSGKLNLIYLFQLH